MIEVSFDYYMMNYKYIEKWNRKIVICFMISSCLNKFSFQPESKKETDFDNFATDKYFF